MDVFFKILNELPPLKTKKNAVLAFAIGLLFGGIGLGIYFLSFIDFILPVVITVLISIILQLVNISFQEGYWLGTIMAGLYGYFRVLNSNEKLDKKADVKT